MIVKIIGLQFQTMMERSKGQLAQALSNTLKYTKNLKLNVSTHPAMQQSSQTSLSHEETHSATAIHKSTKKQSGVFSRQGSPRRQPRNSNELSRKNKQTDVFNMSYKYPVLRKQVQSESEREAGFNRTTDSKLDIKHITNLMSGSVGSKEIIGKKSGHSYTYTHLNDDSERLSDSEPVFPAKFHHSKSPSKERHLQHNSTSYEQGFRQVQPRHIQHQQSERKCEPELIALRKEVTRLQGILRSYETVLLRMKHNYLQIEEKLKTKVAQEHYIDVLKKMVEYSQDDNQKLRLALNAQREALDRAQVIFLGKVKQIVEHYEDTVQQNAQLARQNIFLKRMLMIATDSPQKQQLGRPPQLDPNIVQEPSINTKLSPITDPLTQPLSQNSYLRSVSRSVEEFNNKWR